MNIANILTTARLFMIPLFVSVFYSELPMRIWLSVGVFLLAALTDILDGYFARKYNLVSNFGAIMDPVADKLMQFTAFVCLFFEHIIPLWIVVTYFFKELIMAIGALFLYKKQIVIHSKKTGKISTIITISCVVLILVLKLDFFYATILSSVAIISNLCALVTYALNFKKIYCDC